MISKQIPRTLTTAQLLTERNLRVEVVGDVGHEVGLDGELVGHQRDVVREPVVGRDDGAVTRGVELRAAGATEDLEDVEDAEVDEGAAFRVVDLRSLDDDRVRGEVDAPGEGRGTNEDLEYRNREGSSFIPYFVLQSSRT